MDSMKRENAMEIASSAPHSLTPYTLFRPQFFWSERRIPLGILGAFPAATAIAAALSFNLSMRLAWGQGKRREKGRGGGGGFPLLCPEGALLSTPQTRKTGLLGDFPSMPSAQFPESHCL